MQTFLSYGFRPFFLLAALWAVLAVVVLVVALAGSGWAVEALPLFRWHGHEMIYGFVAAAIAGFLLTAAPTWTGTKPVSGLPLAGLALLWIGGRIAASPLTGLHDTPAVIVDLAFIPAVGVALAGPLIKTRNVRNYPFLLMLGLLFAADAAFHAFSAGWLALPFDPLRFAANIVLVIVVVVGGRIIPAFTRNALVRERTETAIRPAPWLERASIAAIAAVVVVDVFAANTALAGVVAAAAGVLVAARLARWEGLRTLRMPIVFILHVGYGWVAAALALKAVWMLTEASWAVNWLHAQTAGVFGTMILAVTTRVALGHTGRPLVVHRAITVAYALVVVGALVRVFGPVLLPFGTVHVLACAMALWAGGFAVFLAIYAPILIGPRAHGA